MLSKGYGLEPILEGILFLRDTRDLTSHVIGAHDIHRTHFAIHNVGIVDQRSETVQDSSVGFLVRVDHTILASLLIALFFFQACHVENRNLVSKVSSIEHWLHGDEQMVVLALGSFATRRQSVLENLSSVCHVAATLYGRFKIVDIQFNDFC